MSRSELDLDCVETGFQALKQAKDPKKCRMPKSENTNSVCSTNIAKLQNRRLTQAWCPICGCNLTLHKKDGKKTLICNLHGVMKFFLDKDPKAGGE